MTSPLSTFRTELARRWAAVTPPADGSNLGYRYVSGPGDLSGKSAHRTWSLLLDRGVGRKLVHEKGAGSVLMLQYSLTAALRFFRDGRDEGAWLDAIADETELLLRTWSSDATPWGSGVNEVLYTDDTWIVRSDLMICPVRFLVLIERGA